MRTSTLLFGLGIATQIYSQSPSEYPELSSLRTAWGKAREQATAPIDQKYLTALTALKDRLTKSGNLDAAVQVDGEIKKAFAARVPTNTGIGKETTNTFPEAVVGSQWLWVESETKETMILTLNHDGTGSRDSVALSWKKTGARELTLTSVHKDVATLTWSTDFAKFKGTGFRKDEIEGTRKK